MKNEGLMPKQYVTNGGCLFTVTYHFPELSFKQYEWILEEIWKIDKVKETGINGASGYYVACFTDNFDNIKKLTNDLKEKVLGLLKLAKEV